MFILLSDFKYLLKDQAFEYLINNGLIEDLIDHFKALCMRDAIENEDFHIQYSSDGYYTESIDYQYQLNKLGVRIFKEVNYADLEFNKTIAVHFQKSITSLSDVFNQNERKGFIEDPLLKIFSLWLSNYLLTNLTIAEDRKKGRQFKNMKEIYHT